MSSLGFVQFAALCAARLFAWGKTMLDFPTIQRFLDRYVLREMADSTPSGYTSSEWAFPLRHFVNDWITKDMARAICRSLTDRGFATYRRGLFNDDGEVGGAGYGITDKGVAYLAELNSNIEKELHHDYRGNAKTYPQEA